MEALYSVELRHQEDPSDREDEEMGKKLHVAHDWLCVRLGAEHFCVNASRRQGDQGTGEVDTRLSHSFHLLSATGKTLLYIFYILNTIIFTGVSVLLSSGYRCTFQQ